jgi:ABC-2 type transport system permease protein
MGVVTVIGAIARREFASLFRVPLGWLALAAFALVSGWLFVRGVLVPLAPATMRPMFATMGWLLMPLVPAVSMRLVSEELRSGTIEPLTTSPASDYAVIAGKFLGVFAFLMVLLAPLAVHAWVLSESVSVAGGGGLDLGPIAAGALSVALLAGLLLALGLFISTLTSNQTLAFLATFLAILGLLLLPDLVLSSLPREGGAWAVWIDRAAGLARGLRIGARLDDFGKGVIDTGHVVALLAWTVFFLVAAAASLESRRWRTLRNPGRMLRLGGMSFVLIAATLVSAVLASTLADRFARRFDVTATGEHRLSPKAAAVLGSLATDADVIVAADWASLPRTGREDLRDVLDRIGRESPRVRTKVFDFSTQPGRTAYAEFLRGLAAADAPAIAASRAAVESAGADAKALREEIAAGLAPGVTATLAAIPEGGPGLADAVARARQTLGAVTTAGRSVEAAEATAARLMSREIEGVAVPALDEASAGLRAGLDTLARGLVALEAELRTLASAQPRSGAGLRDAANAARDQRERADVLAERVRPVEPPAVVRLADAAARSATLAVKVSGRGVRAVDLAEVVAEGRASAETRRRAEAEVVSALVALTDPSPPIVVFLSMDPALASGARVYDEAFRRVQRLGGDAFAWDLLLSPIPPSLAKINPERKRPVVYAVRMPDQTQTAFGMVPGGIERARRVAEAAQERLAAGRADGGAAGVLVMLAPAVIPASKEPEAAAGLLKPFGIATKTAGVLLREQRGVQGSTIHAEVNAVVRGGGPFADLGASGERGAGLTLLLPWASGVGTEAGVAAAVPGESVWRESRWIDLRRSITEGRPVSATPVFDTGEDERAESFGVLAFGETVTNEGVRRAAAVASAEWLDDPLLRRRLVVDGRPVAPAAGNLDAMETILAWLAGRDTVGGAAGGAGGPALVRSMSASEGRRIAWLLVLGIPAGILTLGVVFRLVRG